MTKTDNPKINLFVSHTDDKGKRYFAYAASTTWAKTCNEAVARYYSAQYPKVAMADIRARFA